MPRNVEYLLEESISKHKVPDFVMTYAIATGIMVPESILKKFGLGYGVDNEFFDYDRIAGLNQQIEKLKAYSDEELIEHYNAKAKTDYQYDLQEYKRQKNWYLQDVAAIEHMKGKVSLFPVESDFESDFKGSLLTYLEERTKEIYEKYKDKIEVLPQPPLPLTLEDAANLRQTELKKLEKEIVDANWIQNEMPKCFERIAMIWLGK